MNKNSAPRSSGFTLIELVMVIILIGVLSALGVGLFAGRSAFSPLLATQQLSSATLLAQQAALAGNDSNSITITLLDDGDLKFSGGGSEFLIGSYGASIGYRSPSPTATFKTITSAEAYSISFDKMGYVAASSDLQTTEFEISGDSGDIQVFLCVNSLGAVYRGRCDGS